MNAWVRRSGLVAGMRLAFLHGAELYSVQHYPGGTRVHFTNSAGAADTSLLGHTDYELSA